MQQAIEKCRRALQGKDVDEANRRLRQIVAKLIVRRVPLRGELVFWTQ